VTGLKIMRKIPKPVFIHGLVIMLALVVTQLLLDGLQNVFLLYMPPIGFALYVLTVFGIQPIILGVLNIIVIHRLYNCQGWQIGFWLNGFFLLLFFTTINVLIQTVLGVPFSIVVGVVEVLLLSYPFGYLAKFSNRGCEEKTHKKPEAENVAGLVKEA
jgi:hypothetical protein